MKLINWNPFYWRNWPVPILYFPITLFVFTIGFLCTRRFFFFSAANPKISLGGFAGDSKSQILAKIPEAYLPYFFVVEPGSLFVEVANKLRLEKLNFPLMAKPDLGESGFLVKKIQTLEQLLKYHQEHPTRYILQEFVDWPMELSILIHTNSGKLEITSITERIHFHVIGNGISSIKELITNHSQGKRKYKFISKHPDYSLEEIPENGLVIYPNSVGNWDYGATYLQRDIDPNSQLEDFFHHFNEKISLFEYGRYDIKCKDWESFLNGEFKVLEINGVKGEPIHIYDPKYSLLQAYRIIFQQWKIILQLSQKNIKKGFVPPSLGKSISILIFHLKAKRKAIKPIKPYETT